MRNAAEILSALKRKKVTQTEIANALGIKQPNAAKLYTPDKRTGKLRALGHDEALKLIKEFGLDDAEPRIVEVPVPAELPSEETFQTVLEEILRLSAEVELPASLARPVSRHLRLCLELLARNPAIQDNEDAIKAVADAVAAQLRGTRQDA